MLRERIYFSDLLYRMGTLTLYKDITEDDIVQNFTVLLKTIVSSSGDIDLLATNYYNFIRPLIVIAEEKGYSGNIWKKHVLSLFLESENAFTMMCERTEDVRSMSIYKCALSDAKTMKILMEADIKNICDTLGHGENMWEYVPVIEKELAVLDQVDYVKDVDKILDLLIRDYNKIGSGKLGLSTVLKYGDEYGPDGLEPILDRSNTRIGDIVGYSEQKARIISNTDAFVKGDDANNCLLIGKDKADKRALLDAMIDKYADGKLKFIEVSNKRLYVLPEMLDRFKSRGMKFIIFVDDLTLQDVQMDYMRVLLEQSLEKRPSNIILYATSTDEGLKEYFQLPIYFTGLEESEYLSIVKSLAKKKRISIGEEFLNQQALEWEIERNMSAKKAEEFINHIVWEMIYH